jgi:hypothetical protein
MIFNVIEAAKLARHRQSQMQKAALLSGPLESQASSEWRDVLEVRHLVPFVIGAFATVNSHGQGQRESLALTPRLLLRFFDSVSHESLT